MCEDDDDNLAEPCTLEVVYALNIQVKDAVTSEYLSSQANVHIQDETYSDNLSVAPLSNPPTFVGAPERSGTYTISVSKPGYVTYVSDPVAVTANACHVIPQMLTIELQPL